MAGATQKERSLLQAILPSSLVSLSIHLSILIVAGLSFQGCEQGVAVPAGGQKYRKVGLAIVPDNSSAETELPAEDPHLESEIVQPSEPRPEQEVPPVVPQDAPSIAQLLGKSPFDASAESTIDVAEVPRVIGAGTPVTGPPEPEGGVPQLAPRPKSVNGLSAAGSPTPGPGETSFMDIIGSGKKFVYVIDTSASMASDRRLDLAKSQLKGSLRLLKPNQKFQVLFYNESISRMKLRNRPAEDMYTATAVHVQLAEAEIARVVAGSGTEHRGPLLNALLLEPDVVYFLTDGDRPRLTREELSRIRSTNRSRARIHVVEFASGPRESRSESWLEMLAEQSGGAYRRINLSRL